VGVSVGGFATGAATPRCVFRINVTGRFGIVTDRSGNVTGDSGGS
jgi:hypothetical protein